MKKFSTTKHNPNVSKLYFSINFHLVVNINYGIKKPEPNQKLRKAFFYVLGPVPTKGTSPLWGGPLGASSPSPPPPLPVNDILT